MRGEAPTYPGARGESSQHRARWSGLPWPSAGGAVDDAEQGSDGHGAADVRPGFELLEAPVVHADLTASAALASAHQDRAAAAVEIELIEIERVLDAQPRAPEDADQRASAGCVLARLAAAHEGDDLFGRRRVGGEVAAAI